MKNLATWGATVVDQNNGILDIYLHAESSSHQLPWHPGKFGAAYDQGPYNEVWAQVTDPGPIRTAFRSLTSLYKYYH
jgi:hypothetical protein